MKQMIYALAWLLSAVFFAPPASAQCPSLTISASPVCTGNISLCSCQITYLDFIGTLPAGWTVSNAAMYKNGFYYPAGQSSAPYGDPLAYQAFFGSDLSYALRDYYPIATTGTFVVELTFSTPTGPQVCMYPLTIPTDSTPASPAFDMHAKTVSQVIAGDDFVTTDFYANDAITFDARPTTDAFYYTVSCTPVNYLGTPIGSSVTSIYTYYPTTLAPADLFINMRSTFSNFVNPSGLVNKVYYRIDMQAVGCSGFTITESRYVNIHNSFRVVKLRNGTVTSSGEEATIDFSITPNPSDGRFIVRSGSLEEQVSIRIVALDGSEVYRFDGADFMETTIDLSAVRKGLYMLTYDNGTTTRTEKVMVF